MNKVLTKEQEGLFLLWATTRMNVKCSTEEELRDKVGNEKVDSLKADYIEHVLK